MYYNGFSESEIFGCKDNNYLEDDEEYEETRPWSYR